MSPETPGVFRTPPFGFNLGRFKNNKKSVDYVFYRSGKIKNVERSREEKVVGALVNFKDLIKIVGFDMETDTKTYFDKGYFYAIAVQRQYYMGQMGVLIPYAINVLGTTRTAELLKPILLSPTFVDTGIDLITTDNYAAYMSFLSELGINS